MKNRINKILITLIAFGFILWFGGAIAKTVISYDIFVPDSELVIKENLSEELKVYNVYLFSTLSVYTDFAYSLVFLSFLIFIVKNNKMLKLKGWLFMIAVLFFAAAPVEFTKMYYDYKLSTAFYYHNLNQFDSYEVNTFFIERLSSQTLRMAFSMSFLANLTALIFLIWQPLDKSNNETKTN